MKKVSRYLIAGKDTAKRMELFKDLAEFLLSCYRESVKVKSAGFNKTPMFNTYLGRIFGFTKTQRSRNKRVRKPEVQTLEVRDCSAKVRPVYLNVVFDYIEGCIDFEKEYDFKIGGNTFSHLLSLIPSAPTIFMTLSP